MPTITIYLTNDLYDKVRDAPSKTVRAALEHYFKDEDESQESLAAPQQPAGQPGKKKDTAQGE
jgi:hypothetical protein